MLRKLNHLILTLILSIANLCNATQTYPPIPLQTEFGKTIITTCSGFPVTGENSIIGRQMLAGTENYLREFKHFATQTDAKGTSFVIKHVKNITQANVSPIIIGLVGAQAMLSLMPQLRAKQCLLLFPTETLPAKTEPLENVIYFRPSQAHELTALTNYAIDTKHKTDIAIIHEASLWSQQLLDTALKILAARNIKPVAIASYAQGTVEIEQALKKITKAAPNTVLCLADPRPAYNFISSALNVGLHECLFLGLSQLSVIQKLLQVTRGLDIAVTSVVPNTQTSTLPIVQEYNNVMKSFLSFRDDSPFYFEAFINLALFEYCLKKIEGPVTIEKIISTFQSFKNVDFKGLSLTFDSVNRSLSSALWINPGNGYNWIACP